jgi:membrane-associated phospholipid phosphatase
MRTSFIIRAAVASLTLGTAACSTSPTAIPTPNVNIVEGPTADVTPRWNALARSLIVTAKPNQQEALRALAYLSLAQHQAAAEISGRPNGDGPISANLTIQDRQETGIVSEDGLANRVDRAAQLRGAIAGASEKILQEMFKANVTDVLAAAASEAVLSAEAGEIASEFEVGREVGRNIGVRLVTAARGDRFDAPWNGTVPTGPGVWFSSIGRAPLLPTLGQMRPFYMTTGADFRPAPPPAYGTGAFTAALNEIRAFSDTRTPAQDSIAKFWAMATGTLAAGYWNEVATSLIAKYRLTEARAAHLLALMNTAAMDGNIACHDAKYTYWVVRPSQADQGIKTAIGLPNHPSYPSNHSCLSGTAAFVLGAELPAERAEMERQATEATESRYYAGLHYRFDGEAGLAIAKRVAELALRVDRELGGKLVVR